MSGRLLVAASGLIGAIIVLSSGPVSATPSRAGGSVIISAVVAPVRYVLVDNHDRIQQILSNSAADVTPVVYKGSFKSAPVVLTPAIAQQYAAVMAGVDAHHTGVIYRAPTAAPKQPISLFARIRPRLY